MNKYQSKIYEIFRVDGTTEILVSPDLKAMQKAVGGYIEYLPQAYLPEGKGGIDIIVNEEGLIHQLLPNITISLVCKGYPVVGDAIVVTEKGVAAFMGDW